MTKKLRPRTDIASKMAAPYRELLRSLLHKKVKSKIEKKKLSEFLGQSVSYVDKMLYEAEGGLDSWICAMSFAYGLKLDHLEKFAAGQLTAGFENQNVLKDENKVSLYKNVSILNNEEVVFWNKAISESRILGMPRIN